MKTEILEQWLAIIYLSVWEGFFLTLFLLFSPNFFNPFLPKEAETATKTEWLFYLTQPLPLDSNCLVLQEDPNSGPLWRPPHPRNGQDRGLALLAPETLILFSEVVWAKKHSTVFQELSFSYTVCLLLKSILIRIIFLRSNTFSMKHGPTGVLKDIF